MFSVPCCCLHPFQVSIAHFKLWEISFAVRMLVCVCASVCVCARMRAQVFVLRIVSIWRDFVIYIYLYEQLSKSQCSLPDIFVTVVKF